MWNRSAFRNRILSLLSEADFSLISGGLEQVELPLRFVMVEPEQPIEHVYFPEAGLGSIIAISTEGLEAEAGILGRDGFAPTAVTMGSDSSPHRHIVQLAGEGHRIERQRLCDALDRSPTLRGLLLRFVLTLNVQTTYTALSNAVHQIDERLARWLLMCHDRGDGDEIALTHDFMSVMLAVRRPSVTTALHLLEGNGFIRSARGCVIIRDRAALEEFAGDAYGKPEAEYRRLIGAMS